jgi:hypothetical protein
MKRNVFKFLLIHCLIKLNAFDTTGVIQDAIPHLKSVTIIQSKILPFSLAVLERTSPISKKNCIKFTTTTVFTDCKGAFIYSPGPQAGSLNKMQTVQIDSQRR